MEDTQVQKLLKEIKNEQHPLEDDNTIVGYIKDGEYDINDAVGAIINYEIDLKAKSLLKNYVLYARYKRLAEFKQLYADWYAFLQAKYYELTSV